MISDSAYATSVYSASASATIDLISPSSGLAYRGSRINYGANAQATANGSTVVDDKPVFSSSLSTPDPSTDILLGNTSLSDLLAGSSNSIFQTVNAVNDGAEGRGRSNTISPGNTAHFGAEAFGQATNPVESASSRVRWDVLIAFENISTENLVASWAVSYFLKNEAMADPRGTAFSTSRVRVQRSRLVNGTRTPEAGFFEAETAACGVTSLVCDPGSQPSGSLIFNIELEAGEIGFLNVELVAAGNASVVPLPAALPLFGTGLALLGLLGRRRKLRFSE